MALYRQATAADGALLAQRAITRAIKNGDICPAKECLCVDCGKAAQHYDHRDYSKQLVVDPVCARCNQLRGPAIAFVPAFEVRQYVGAANRRATRLKMAKYMQDSINN